MTDTPEPYWRSRSGALTLYGGDCREVLKLLPAGSVQCAISSPPYYSLRDYGTGTWEGGSPDCDHLESSESRTANSVASSGLEGGKGNVHRSHTFRGQCGKCGAVRVDNQIGLEESPAAYVEAIVGVFREVKRVLHNSGVAWVNIADSYAASGRGGNSRKRGETFCGVSSDREEMAGTRRYAQPGQSGKNLLLIPSRLAIALQDDGWTIRSVIPWLKANCMPESVGDRPTTAHEYILMLAKEPTYFYDVEAVRVAANSFGRQHTSKVQPPKVRAHPGKHNGDLSINYERSARNRRTFDWWFDSLREILQGGQGMLTDEEGDPLALPVNPKSYKGSHFATFPERLVRPLDPRQHERKRRVPPLRLLLAEGGGAAGCREARGGRWRSRQA